MNSFLFGQFTFFLNCYNYHGINFINTERRSIVKKAYILSEKVFQLDGKMPLFQAFPLVCNMFWLCLSET